MSVTSEIALWGAITGTIGTVTGVLALILRYREYRSDQAKLWCAPNFRFEHSAGMPRPMHTIVMRCVGKRPLSIEHVCYLLRPPKLHQRVIKRWLWRRNRWVYRQEPRQRIRLSEGESAEVSIALPKGVEYSDICAVRVMDQAGRSWPVRWPRRKEVERQVDCEVYEREEGWNCEYRVCISKYRAANRYHIYIECNTTPGAKGQIKGTYYNCRDANDFEEKINHIRNTVMPCLLQGKDDECFDI